MTAAECREHEAEAMAHYQAALNMDGKGIVTHEERKAYGEIARRALTRAAEWDRAAQLAEEMENET